MIVLWSILCLIVGLLLYAYPSNAKIQRIGEIMIFWGIGVTLLALTRAGPVKLL
jgi:Na+/phosphate symporter